MITRILALVCVVVVCNFSYGDEGISKAYLERGIETAKIAREDAKKFIAHFSEQQQAITNGVYEGDKSDKAKEQQRLTEKLEYYNEVLCKVFQTPRINGANVEVPSGAVGVLDNIGPYDSIADPVRPYQVKVVEVDDGGFLADVKFSNAKKVYFQGFDKSKIEVGKEIELADAVVVVGTTDTSFGRQLTIRKLSEQELRDAQNFAKQNTPGSNTREWSYNDGKIKIKAEFIGIEGSTVTLKKEDGQEVRVLLSKFSKTDRDWLKENRRVE